MKDEHNLYGWIGPQTPAIHEMDWRDGFAANLKLLHENGLIDGYLNMSQGELMIARGNLVHRYRREIMKRLQNDLVDLGWVKKGDYEFNIITQQSRGRVAYKDWTPPDRLEEITDMLVKTYRDKKIRAFHILPSEEVVWDSQGVNSETFKLTDYDGIFNALEALYNEEFEIETQDDIKKVVEGAEVTLSNGVKLSAVRNCENGLFLWQPETGIEEWVMIIALKGAKVKQ